MGICKASLIEKIEGAAPRNLAEDWDNCGMQVDCGNKEVKRMLISLEITDSVIDEAIECEADFILTHHPLLFNKIQQVDSNDFTGNYIFRLIKADISVYAAHTSFDSAFSGNNDYLFYVLGLTRFRKMAQDESEGISMCRMGELKTPMTLKKVCKLVEEKLKLKRPVRVVGDLNKPITSLGFCTGAGGDFLELAEKNGCDVFITGDVKHHHALWAKEVGLAVIDAGHYGTEWIFVPNMAEQIRKTTEGKVEIIQSSVDTDPFN